MFGKEKRTSCRNKTVTRDVVRRTIIVLTKSNQRSNPPNETSGRALLRRYDYSDLDLMGSDKKGDA
jgi:hypothetical protein